MKLISLVIYGFLLFQTIRYGGLCFRFSWSSIASGNSVCAKQSDAVLLGAIGGHKWNTNEKHMKPETGLAQLRAGPEVFANLSPATVLPQLVVASTLKKEVAEAVDFMIYMRHLFGKPRGFDTDDTGEEIGYNTGVLHMRGQPGLFKPIHGSPPNIAGQDEANPLATILSVAMLLKYALGEENATKRIENTVLGALNKGFRTGDINSTRNKFVGCKEMGEEILKSVESQVPATL